MARMNWDKVRRQHSAERNGAESASWELRPDTDTEGGTLVPRRKVKNSSPMVRCEMCGVMVRSNRVGDHKRKVHRGRTSASKRTAAKGGSDLMKCTLCGDLVRPRDARRHLAAHRVKVKG